MLLADLSSLLHPINPSKACGENLEDELLFLDIIAARESDPDYLPDDEWSLSEPKVADWKKVYQLTESALREKTKDLQLCCWLVEALFHVHNLTGLNHGLQFFQQFLQQYWEDCWPSLTEQGIPRRNSILQRLDRELGSYLLSLSLLGSTESSLAHWRNILSFEHRVNSHPNNRDYMLKKEGDLTLETFSKQAKAFNLTELEDQQQCIVNIQQHLSIFEERYTALTQQKDTVIFSLTSQHLQDAQEFLQRTRQFIPKDRQDETFNLYPDELIENNQQQSSNTESTLNSELTNQNSYLNSHQTFTQKGVLGSIACRDDAINQMLLIADFFREREPMSPVPYLMERSARWAMMDLQEWLNDVLVSDESLDQVNNVLIGNPQ